MSSVAEKLQRKSQKAAATKQVRLKLVYVDFWSAVKLSFLIAVAFGIVLVVASALLWLVLDTTGLFGKVDALLQEILNDNSFSVTSVVSFGTVLMFSIITALLNTVIGTALGAIGALMYNFSVRITGGLLVGFTNN
jgi:ABC-type Fe3+ transport system permease subunit